MPLSSLGSIKSAGNNGPPRVLTELTFIHKVIKFQPTMSIYLPFCTNTRVFYSPFIRALHCNNLTDIEENMQKVQNLTLIFMSLFAKNR